MALPKIDPNHAHAAEAAEARDKLVKAKVDPAMISMLIQMILNGMPGILAFIQKLIDHTPPTPKPAPPAKP